MLAHEAAHELGLDEVLLVPTGEAPHKTIEADPGARVRLEMTELAAQGDELLSVSDSEVSREGPSYTYLTLERLAEERPDEEIHFLMGADVAAQLEAWKRPERVLELARVAIAARPGTDIEAAEAALGRLGSSDRGDRVEMPELAISSTGLRARIAAGKPVKYLVPDGVIDLIAARGLYREAVPV